MKNPVETAVVNTDEIGKRFFVVSAPSGAGKTTLCQNLLDRHPDAIRVSISCTTRKPRGEERDGVEYFFLSKSEFFERREAGDFLEWAQVHGNYYATSRSHVEDLVSRGYRVLFDVDVQGAEKIKAAYPAATLVFVIAPSRAELERRLRERKTDDPVEIERRLGNALGEMVLARIYDYIIVNDDVVEASEKLDAIVFGDAKPDREDGRRQLDRIIAEFENE